MELVVEIKDWDCAHILEWDRGFGLGNGIWIRSLDSGIEICDLGLGLEIAIGDWDRRFGFGIGT